jgi:hypothetical protein
MHTHNHDQSHISTHTPQKRRMRRTEGADGVKARSFRLRNKLPLYNRPKNSSIQMLPASLRIQALPQPPCSAFCVSICTLFVPLY